MYRSGRTARGKREAAEKDRLHRKPDSTHRPLAILLQVYIYDTPRPDGQKIVGLIAVDQSASLGLEVALRASKGVQMSNE